MAWIQFNASSKDVVPRLTIRKNGHFGISDSALAAYNLKNYKYVLLFIDEEEKRIGFKFIHEKEQGAKEFKIHPKAGAYIPAKGFLKVYGLDKLGLKHLECSFDKQENMLIANYA